MEWSAPAHPCAEARKVTQRFGHLFRLAVDAQSPHRLPMNQAGQPVRGLLRSVCAERLACRLVRQGLGARMLVAQKRQQHQEQRPNQKHKVDGHTQADGTKDPIEQTHRAQYP